jgi:hypothetical protein
LSAQKTDEKWNDRPVLAGQNGVTNNLAKGSARRHTSWCSGDTRRLYGWLMHVELFGSGALQNITGPLDFVDCSVRDQQELSGFDRSLVFHHAVLRDTEAE